MCERPPAPSAAVPLCKGDNNAFSPLKRGRAAEGGRGSLTESAYVGIRLLFFASHWSNDCSSGLSLRATSALLAARHDFSKSQYTWNMLPISSAPGNPKLR